MTAALESANIGDPRAVPEPQWWPERPAWQTQAACRGMDSALWFPEPSQLATEAKRICATCAVSGPCGDYAEANRESHGVWGGQTPKERGRGRHAGRALSPVRGDVARMAARGASSSLIADVLGVSRRTVTRYLEEGEA